MMQGCVYIQMHLLHHDGHTNMMTTLHSMDIVLNYMIQHLNYIAYCASHDVLAPKVFNPNSTSYTLFKKLIKVVFKALD